MKETRFEFGRNWSDYIRKHFSEERVAQTQKQMLEFLGCENLQGKSFLDIGCGSGLHSLAAYQAGAKQVLSFDYDENSVAATNHLHKYVGQPSDWTIRQGSILDLELVRQLPKADIVYSWGVLHHTGDVWTALENAASLVADDGVFYCALYSANFYRQPPPEYWLDIKKKYVEGGAIRKRWMELGYIWKHELRKKLHRIPWLLRHIRQYDKSRGMDWYTDVKDWLGGWPMEFCWDEDVTEKAGQLGLMQQRIKTGQGNTEFLFARQTSEVHAPHAIAAPHRDAARQLTK